MPARVTTTERQKPATGLLGAAIGIHDRVRYLTDRSMFGRRVHEHTAWPRRLSGRSRACTSVVGSEVSHPRKGQVDRRSRSRTSGRRGVEDARRSRGVMRPGDLCEGFAGARATWARSRRGVDVRTFVRRSRTGALERHGLVLRQRRHEPSRPRVVARDQPGPMPTSSGVDGPNVELEHDLVGQTNVDSSVSGLDVEHLEQLVGDGHAELSAARAGSCLESTEAVSIAGTSRAPGCPSWGHRFSLVDVRTAFECGILQTLMSNDNQPSKKAARARCGARCRSKAGAPCVAPVAVVAGRARNRCRMHGGLSTGPRTPEGRARVLAGVRARWERWRASRCS